MKAKDQMVSIAMQFAPEQRLVPRLVPGPLLGPIMTRPLAITLMTHCVSPRSDNGEKMTRILMRLKRAAHDRVDARKNGD